MKKAFFRVDGASFIGYGHLYRSFVLAMEFSKNGFEVFYITRDFENSVKKFIRSKGFECVNILQDFNHERYWKIATAGMDSVLDEDCRVTESIAQGNILVCDNYSLSSDYYKKINSTVKMLIAFDDINDREYPVDVLINQNLGSEKLNFNVKPDTKVLAGLKYVLIRDELIQAKNKNAGSEMGYLLVMFGATDSMNFTDRVLEAIENEKINIVAVVGRGAANKEIIAEKWSANKFIKVFVDPPNVDYLMAGAKAVITAAGSSVWEFSFLQKPMMIVKISENQKYISEIFKENKLLIELHSNDNNQNKIRADIVDFYNNADRFKNYTINKYSIDGNGKKRILSAILKACNLL